jgi:hypothetical protein
MYNTSWARERERERSEKNSWKNLTHVGGSGRRRWGNEMRESRMIHYGCEKMDGKMNEE